MPASWLCLTLDIQPLGIQCTRFIPCLNCKVVVIKALNSPNTSLTNSTETSNRIQIQSYLFCYASANSILLYQHGNRLYRRYTNLVNPHDPLLTLQPKELYLHSQKTRALPSTRRTESPQPIQSPSSKMHQLRAILSLNVLLLCQRFR